MTKKYIEDNDLRRSNDRAEAKMLDTIQHGEPIWDIDYDKEKPEKIKEQKHISLMICGHCGKRDNEHIEKVIEGKYANMLCYSCRCLFEVAIADVAKKYLTTNPLLIEYEQ